MTDLDLSKVTWGEFLIGDLLYKVETNKTYKTKTYKNSIPATASSHSNNQLTVYVKKQGSTILKNMFSATANGTGKCFYQPFEFTIYQDSYAMDLKEKNQSKNIKLFYLSSLNKIYNQYDWNYKSNWNRVREETIKLPVTKDGNIDYDFMDRYVENMKEHYYKNRKETLEQNIKKKMEISEISDLNLTEEETKAILKMKNNKVQWGEFLIGDLFYGVNGTKDIKKKNIKINGKTTVVSAGENNTGVIGKTNIKSNLISKNTITIDMFGNAFYRNFEYYIVTHARVFALIPKNKTSKNSMIFITSALKYLSYYYSYEYMATWSKVQNNKIKLPVTDNGSIDYEFMELYTQAMHKYIIKKEIIKNEQYMKHLKTLTYKGD